MIENIRIYKINEILNDLNNCINNKKPFSLIRIGDGGAKLLKYICDNDIEKLKPICIKEGFPIDKSKLICDLWTKYINMSSYIDSPQVYFEDYFWDRIKRPDKKISSETKSLLKNWNIIYENANFKINKLKYCNPEINFLSCLRISLQLNLIDILKNKNICCIYTNIKIKNILNQICNNIDVYKIPNQFENHYEKSKDVFSFLKNNSDKYDLILVAAGEIGRIYSGYIKENNGRAFDIGSVLDSWINRQLPQRLQYFIRFSDNNIFEFELLDDAKKYEMYL